MEINLLMEGQQFCSILAPIRHKRLHREVHHKMRTGLRPGLVKNADHQSLQNAESRTAWYAMLIGLLSVMETNQHQNVMR